jgi:MFS family permease
MAGASLLMLVVWGKLADRIGNRPVLVLVGILVALTPLLWLGTGSNFVCVWVWFPLLHLLMGGTNAAIDLCNNNLLMVVAPKNNQATYFATVAAVAGVGGALGTTAGGFLAEFVEYGGLPGLFALSSVLRLAALLPLMWVQEKRSQTLIQVMRSLLPMKPQFATIPALELVSRSK